jgi:hypothetical protein
MEMMMRSTSHAWLLGLFVAVSIACQISGNGSQPLGTSAASTLTAAAAQDDGHARLTNFPTAIENTPHAIASTAAAPGPLRVAYTNGGNAWIKTGSAAPLQLTSSGDIDKLLISDDGELVAYLRYGNRALAPSMGTVQSDGSGQRIIVPQARLQALYPVNDEMTGTDIDTLSFLPGGHDLFFNSKKIMAGPGLIKNDDLWRLNMDTGILTNILLAGDGGDFFISPDATQIIEIRQNGASLSSLGSMTQQVKAIAFSPVMTYSEGGFYPEVVWSQDSAKAGIIVPTSDPLASAAGAAIWLLDRKTKSAAKVDDLLGQFVFSRGKFSPDLTRVCFLRDQGTSERAVYIAEVGSGRAPILVATGDSVILGWSTDSRYLAYSLGSSAGFRIYSVEGRMETISATAIQFQWISPIHYLYVTGSDAAWTIFLGIVGGDPQTVASGMGGLPNIAVVR